MPYRLMHNSEAVREWDNAPKRLDVPGVGSVHGVSPGWTSNGYAFEWFERPPVVDTTPLDGVKERLRRQIDDQAEAVRLRYITHGVGQAMTYREKLEQAEQVIEDGEDAANALSADDARAKYPTLSASIGVEAATLWQCANLVWQTYQQWAALSHTIEKARLTAKKAIDDATTVDAAYQAHAGAAWPK